MGLENGTTGSTGLATIGTHWLGHIARLVYAGWLKETHKWNVSECPKRVWSRLDCKWKFGQDGQGNSTDLALLISLKLIDFQVWDLSEPSASAHIPSKPTYTLHTSFPIRKVAWRPDYSCELAIISNTEFGSGSDPDMFGLSSKTGGPARSIPSTSTIGDPIEIWDVRRGYLPKWSMHGFVGEGGITGKPQFCTVLPALIPSKTSHFLPQTACSPCNHRGSSRK